MSKPLVEDDYNLILTAIRAAGGAAIDDRTVTPVVISNVARFVINGQVIPINVTLNKAFGIQQLYLDGYGNVRVDKHNVINTGYVKPVANLSLIPSTPYIAAKGINGIILEVLATDGAYVGMSGIITEAVAV